MPGHLVGSYDEILGAYVGSELGRLADPMPFVGIIATAADPSLAPEGEDTLYVWSGWTPLRPHESWDTLADRAGRELVEHASLYYEGIEGLEIGRSIEAWPQLAERTRVPDGNIMHVDSGLLRQGPLRPALGLGGYRTPVEGLFLTGAGTIRRLGFGHSRPARGAGRDRGSTPGIAPAGPRPEGPRRPPRARLASASRS